MTTSEKKIQKNLTLNPFFSQEEPPPTFWVFPLQPVPAPSSSHSSRRPHFLLLFSRRSRSSPSPQQRLPHRPAAVRLPPADPVAPPNSLHSGSLLPQLRPTHGCAHRPAVAPCAQETLPSPPLGGSSSPSTAAGHTRRNPHL